MLTYDKRDLDGMTPNIAQPDSKNMAADFVARLNDVRGTASIPIGASTVNVDVAVELHGQPLFATLNGVFATGAADATATSLTSVRWSTTVTGRFSVNVNANATAAVRVSYMVAGK